MSPRKYITALAFLTVAGVSFAETIVIGAEDDWYPYGGKLDGRAAGLGVDLVRASFKAVGIDVEFRSMPYARCLELVKRGELLACNEPARTAETEPHLLWPDRPLFKARSLIYARKSSTNKEVKVSALEGQSVAITNGFEYGSSFDTNRKVKREVVGKEISVFRMLAARRVEYALAYEKVANWYFNKYPAEFKDQFEAVGVISETQMYCAFSKTFPESRRYLNLFNEGFTKIVRNGNYRDILARYP